MTIRPRPSGRPVRQIPQVAVRIIDNCVAGGACRVPGDVLELPAPDAALLQRDGRAVPATAPVGARERARLERRDVMDLRVVRHFAELSSGRVHLEGERLHDVPMCEASALCAAGHAVLILPEGAAKNVGPASGRKRGS